MKTTVKVTITVKSDTYDKTLRIQKKLKKNGLKFSISAFVTEKLEEFNAEHQHLLSEGEHGKEK